MHTGTALLVATGLVALSAALLAGSGAPGDVLAVAGGITASLAVALVALTALATWWRATERSYVETAIDPLYDELVDVARDGDADDRAAAG